MFWSKNKHLNSNEYIKLAQDVVLLSARLDAQEQLVKSLRGLVNRKLDYEGNDPQAKVDTSGETQTNLNPTTFLTPNGSIIKPN